MPTVALAMEESDADSAREDDHSVNCVIMTACVAATSGDVQALEQLAEGFRAEGEVSEAWKFTNTNQSVVFWCLKLTLKAHGA
jgi:hypothetical protein